MIEPDGSTWHPFEDANRALREAVRRLFIEPWHSYSQIPNTTRQAMFNEFKTLCTRRRKYNLVISMTFERKSSGALSRWLKAAKDTRELSDCLLPDIFERLCFEYWDTPKFMKSSTQAKKDRISGKGGSLHTASAKGTAKIAREMELVRKLTQAEVFRRTHIKSGYMG